MTISARSNQASETWSIREFANLFEITPRTLRFYEDKGLIGPDRSSGSRVFGPLEHARLTSILRGKRLGFTLEDIKAVLDVTDGRITNRSELEQSKFNFEKVIKSLNRRRADIDILSQEMGELCQILEDQLSNSHENAEVIQLAEAYDIAFRKHLSPNPLNDS